MSVFTFDTVKLSVDKIWVLALLTIRRYENVNNFVLFEKKSLKIKLAVGFEGVAKDLQQVTST